MFFSMIVGLYTSRILLQALGVEDYGIYNVVGGFVMLFAVVSSALSGAISRYITFELGRGNIELLKKTFGTSVIVLCGLGLIIIAFGETVGLWFVNHKLVIPENRLFAVFGVYQFAIATFVIELLSTPYSACVISHERMDIYAYISIFGVVSKLIICFIVLHTQFDRLIIYSALLFTVSLTVTLVYILYGKKKFIECKGKITFQGSIIKQMFQFAGWSFVGSSGWIFRSQGGTILLNLFGGAIVNAGNAIAMSLSSAVTNFSNCITSAFTPQITKSYAGGDYNTLHTLLFYGPKLSFYMLFFIALPVMLNTEFVLRLWLGEIPEYSVVFVRAILILSLIEVISVPLITAKNATGNIRNYQLIVGGIQLLAVPMAYVFLKLGAPMVWLYIAYIITSIICLFARLMMLRGDIPSWSITAFLKNVCLNVTMVAVIAAIVPVIAHFHVHNEWSHFFVTCVLSVVSCFITIYYVGFMKNERKIISQKLKSILKRDEE